MINRLPYHRLAAMAYDMVCIPTAWLLAYWLRFNLTQIPALVFQEALWCLPGILVLQVISFWTFGLYRGVWRFASIADLMRISQAVMVGVLSALLAGFLTTRLNLVPRSVIPIYSLLLLCSLGAGRFIYRWLKDRSYLSQTSEQVLIVGAGFAGESLIRDLLRDTKRAFIPMGLVDDDLKKQGRELHGVRVLGQCTDIPAIVKKYPIDRILIALPSANAKAMRRIVAICESTQKLVRTLPGMNDLVAGLVSVKHLRENILGRFIGRAPVALDWQSITQEITHKVIVVSGGGGSIGSELCRQILTLAPAKLIIIDHCEYNLFCIQEELQAAKKSPLIHLDYQLLDIGDKKAIGEIFSLHQPDIIFHAAAYKHVPLLEQQLRVAAKNNIGGTYCLAELAVQYRIKKFVLVSTDKAVNPTNIMGATKRVAELVCQSFNQRKVTRFIIVRFGNVLGSRGSVVETFKRQLEKGGPLTVTHPEVKRYFMTIPEAAQLILQANALGVGGELFVLDMGEPVRISYLAEQMIRLAGSHKDEITIEYVGLRPGEKLFEELFYQTEEFAKTQHEKILTAQAMQWEWPVLASQLTALQEAIYHCQPVLIAKLLQQLVPELQLIKVPSPLADVSLL